MLWLRCLFENISGEILKLVIKTKQKKKTSNHFFSNVYIKSLCVQRNVIYKTMNYALTENNCHFIRFQLVYIIPEKNY